MFAGWNAWSPHRFWNAFKNASNSLRFTRHSRPTREATSFPALIRRWTVCRVTFNRVATSPVVSSSSSVVVGTGCHCGDSLRAIPPPLQGSVPFCCYRIIIKLLITYSLTRDKPSYAFNSYFFDRGDQDKTPGRGLDRSDMRGQMGLRTQGCGETGCTSVERDSYTDGTGTCASCEPPTVWQF
jgi:hypothetical protein